MVVEKVDRKAPKIMAALAVAIIYKKQGTVRARRAVVGEKVTTTLSDSREETTNTARDGDYLVQNPTGERYLVDFDTFFKRYQMTTERGVYEARGYCRAIKNPFGHPIEIMASWGTTQTGDENCFIADTCDQHGSEMGGEPYLIDSLAFHKTYQWLPKSAQEHAPVVCSLFLI